jgi:hypothetical protein
VRAVALGRAVGLSQSSRVVSVTVSATAASCSLSCSDALMLPSCRVPSADSSS